MIKHAELEMKKSLDYTRWAQMNETLRKNFCQVQSSGEVTKGGGLERWNIAGFQDGGRGHEPRNMGGLGHCIRKDSR